MKRIRSPKKFQSLCLSLRRGGKRIGFVPTMGFLHEGHLSLFRKARRENDVVIGSIFVNPTQFGPREDFDRYPRNLKRDCALLAKEKVDWLFTPNRDDLYPEGYQTFVEPGALARGLCGRSRPGHFRGVATVVMKLLNLSLPSRIYLGQKDYQQALVIRRLVEDFHVPAEVKICPIVRASDGLALSSRNSYLSPEERRRALCFFKSLGTAKEWIGNGERNPRRVRAGIRKILVPGLSRVDYIEILDARDLSRIKRISGRIVIALAGFVGKVRLIDNCVLNVPG
ncbi:MAG TPA: pantoate--beta-alanine ligase [Candidatus Omnitrophota bacterium]|nr:pantoate--beta-alanine ligase [Candidatus Omnitrophota bacterium]